MFVLFCSSFVSISAYANVYFKTTIFKQNIKIILIAGVPSSQALPGFLITAPPSVCVPAVVGVLAVWIQQQKQKNSQKKPSQNKNKNKAKRDPSISNSAWECIFQMNVDLHFAQNPYELWLIASGARRLRG